ncbi:MAG TPA: tRNA (adenosine(37)-N6)-threonylcarbamoyltransferase complex ATPase subunit type 1 TsaE [bacterium]|nr:tRNA (adenosine(37)-N6)-threonylcarbamoyltransferase complex ATPase subunit type 1 TsaE [bacterium]
MKTIISHNEKETKNLGEKLIIDYPKNNIFSLSGNLGSGKTMLTQGLAKSLGIKKNITSPTFVILNSYRIKNNQRFKNLIHIDAYRLKNKKDLENIAWFDLIKQTDNIIIVEWGEKIKKYLPKSTVNIKFKIQNNNDRKIIISS